MSTPATPAAPAANAPVSNENIESTPQVDGSEAEASEEGAEASTPEGQTPGAEAKVAEKTAKKVEALRRKLKLKVDGKEIEEEIDLNDDEYLTRQLQLAKAAQKRMQEYSQLEKEVGKFLNDLKTNPRKVLSDPNIGIDVKQLAAQIIEEEITNSQKTPQQLEKEKLETELKSLREEREREKAEFQRKEFERVQQQQFEYYDKAMTKALDGSDLPKSPYVVKKMADYMLMALETGKDVQPEDVLPLVREEIMNDIKEMFGVMPDEVVEKIVGKDVIGRIRKKSVAKAKTAPTPVKSSVKDTGITGSEEKKDPQKKSFKDFFGV